jgi:hypothetical protein
MKTYTEQEVNEMLTVGPNPGGVLEHDNMGQLIIYTNIFRWTDGSHHDEPDPLMQEDLDDA